VNFNEESAAFYIRVSTNNESQDDSYEEQFEMLEREMKRRGLILYKVYKERITATKTDGRHEFDKMLEDAQNGRFQAIFTKDLSRISRNQETAQKFRRIVLENNINVFTLSDGENIQQDSLLFGIKSLTNEQYSADISKKVKASFRNKMLKGDYTRPEAPYGYYVKDRKLFIRDDESPSIVRRIYKMYLEDGRGVDAIANQLDKEGIVTPGMLKGKRNAGKHWLGSTVNYILSNPSYKGDLVQHKEETIGIYTKKRKSIEEPIIIKNAHEGIISIDTFNETQRLMERRASGPRPTPALHLFTDFILCGKCGKRYWYRSAGNRYICGSYAKFGKRVCSANAIREDILIEVIKNDLKSMVEKYNAENEKGDDIGNYLKSKMYSIKTEKEMLVSKKEKYEESKTSLILSKAMKEITAEEYEASVKMLKEKINAIKERLDELEGINLKIDEMQIENKIKENFFGTANFDIITREMLNKLIDKIVVNGKNDIEIHYQFKM
jgi:DNA invertase Pin-like site-specific DNA recombinase